MMNPNNEITVRIDPENARVVLEEAANGVISRKEISADTLYECIRASIRAEAFTGFLPENCLAAHMSDRHKTVFVWHPKLRADVTLHETEYPDFPLPRMVFGFKLSCEGKVISCKLGVVGDEKPKPETPMYRYPFSNVSGTAICTGANALPVYKDLRTVATLPDFILRIPNNFDSYSAKNNGKGMDYRELMEHLKDKGPKYYYSDILIPNGKTLSDFIKGDNLL